MSQKMIWAQSAGALILVGIAMLSAGRETAVEEDKIAPLMGQLQRFSQKLGYSVATSNFRLSEFYFEELEEVFAELKTIESHDGLPIADTVPKIMAGPMNALKTSLARQDGEGLEKAYRGLITGCNDCHAATEHEYIVILAPEGPPPFNQKF